ncbi:polysaccharide deacetylase family protein [Opitutus sp. GAS368]|jgi:undecaprenyl phosphate-alpha-L-ara4FN deformylase|uniref:polysaccharide deacetylase family protein n=1 Tax=Opitutus sp. GAS368 TaxID=1882749 RepID=UPI00087D56CF|nr:polysaccharide deacetylase family protein [Opitutus sp. GAS368]SDR69113.1 Polysaccharide deacetylase [Opitutus sp. GAS368]
MALRLALKIDVDTDRGTRLGVPNLLADLGAAGVPATFLFSLGPDQTGRAITRVFRPGFLKKVGRTSIVELYGVRTLLNGTLLPAPHIGRRNEAMIRSVRDAGFETGIHCYSHYRWQDYVHTMSPGAVSAEFEAARTEFRRIFGTEAVTAGAAGWQANANSRAAYDRAGLLYASDTRGTAPFFPRIGDRTFATLEIPSTLPTVDELMGRPEFPDDRIVPHLLSLLRPDALNVFTLHAEIEGLGRRGIFRQLLAALPGAGVGVVSLEEAARQLLAQRASIPACELQQGSIDGRSGLLAVQGPPV